MSEGSELSVAIVDYGLGNLFSVKQACQRAGLAAAITSSKGELLQANAVLLPGVGAFGDAMDALRKLDLVPVLNDVAASGKPLVGICLGMQLLMTHSYEFGRHQGLGILEGEVVRLTPGEPAGVARRLKVPQIGWNRIRMTDGGTWDGSLLDGLQDGEWMYFVHSFYVRPADPSVGLSVTRYGAVEFCSSLRRGNLFACQFHPERSGPMGIRLYENLASQLKQAGAEVHQA